MKIAIIDYGMCNLDSVARAVEKCGGNPCITDTAAALEVSDAIILPGVGAYKDAMAELNKRGLVDLIRDLVLKENVPFLGICLGMHLMATEGLEGGLTKGLNLIPGKVLRFKPVSENERIPHIGWNEVEILKKAMIFRGISNKSDFYFVHSYHLVCDDNYVLANTPYCGKFVSAIGRNNCYGVQFHPEKSLKTGLNLISNFIEAC